MFSRTQKTNIRNIALITFTMSVVWAASAELFMKLLGVSNSSTADPGEAALSSLTLLAVCFLSVGIVTWFVNRTHLTGLKLATQVFVMVFGVTFFMSQIETMYFNSVISMPWQVLTAVIASGVLASLSVAVLSARFRRKLGKVEQTDTRPNEIKMYKKFATLSLLYTVFYFVFGYFIAWQVPELREYYSGSTDILPFWSHMLGVLRDDPLLPAFQIVRGLIWAGIGYSVIVGLVQMKTWERSIIVGLALSIGLATPLFVPNEYMPDIVRAGHFFELLIENFLFGVLVALVFKPQLSAQ